MERFLEFFSPAICQLLCHDCHAEKTAAERRGGTMEEAPF